MKRYEFFLDQDTQKCLEVAVYDGKYVKFDDIKHLINTKINGWVITKPGNENLAFHHKSTAIDEMKRLGYKTIQGFHYEDV
jgi:hypothetical protein